MSRTTTMRPKSPASREMYRWLDELTLEKSDDGAAGDTRGSSQRVEQNSNRTLEGVAYLHRLMSMGQLAASLGHELGQPLAAIRANAQAAVRLANAPEPDLEEIRSALADIVESNARAQSVLENMRAVFQNRAIALQSVDLNKIVTDVARLVRHDADRRGVGIRLILASTPVQVFGDGGVIGQVILNLINNGMDAMSGVPARRRLLTLTTNAAHRGTVLIEDCGNGVASENKRKIFRPRFTTKAEGMGLGLSICRRLVEFLQGRIVLQDRRGPGAAFLVELPLAVHANTVKAS